VEWFGDYARIMFEALGDRGDTWITFNEPFIDAFIIATTSNDILSRHTGLSSKE
jgi:beta-glucosidase/6-phospho-beta-glucosidase/beta-galactosidase